MNLDILKIKDIPADISTIYLINTESDLAKFSFSSKELKYIKSQSSDKKKTISINSYNKWSYIQWIEKNDEKQFAVKENLRKAAGKLYSTLKENKHTELILVDLSDDSEYALAFIEGLALSHYQFSKYITKEKDKKNKLNVIKVFSKNVTKKQIEDLKVLIDAVYRARDLVNEPLSFLTAEQLSQEIKKMGIESGFDVEILNKKKIEALKLNGLLAINKGSIDPPTFSILTYKPENAINIDPYILVGKGIVYDTGGLSLKPTNFMDTMKSDMAGGAAVASTFYALAKTKIPVYVIGLIPATDNRPDGNAITPGDIVTMHNGITVEILNTDAEGRMIIADALSFAQKFNPKLVIDLATLTGAAVAAIGTQGSVAMGNVKNDDLKNLIESGNNVYERIVEFPLWDEYNEMLKSDIADLKNIGGKFAGAITAGKFLEQFVDYPWIHIDIAGTAFLDSSDNYRGKGATGIGVRLLIDFFNCQVKA